MFAFYIVAEGNNTYIGSRTFNLGTGATTTVSMPWTATVETGTLQAVITHATAMECDLDNKVANLIFGLKTRIGGEGSCALFLQSATRACNEFHSQGSEPG